MCVVWGLGLPIARVVIWELWLVGFGEEKPMARFQSMKNASRVWEVGQACWVLACFLPESKRPSSLLLWGCLYSLWSFPPVCQNEHCTAHQDYSHGQMLTLGYPCSISFSRPGESPVSWGWEQERFFWASLHLFIVPRAGLNVWTFTYQKSLLEQSLFPLQLLRLAGGRFHISQEGHKGGFPVRTPTLNSLETEVQGIAYFISLTLTLAWSCFPKCSWKELYILL